MKEKNIYIIAGCNGAGKTTASFTILPEILDCKEFVNADEIAKGLSPFQPEKVAFEAGRIMLERIETLLKSNENFAFETTLSTKTYKQKLLQAKANGFKVKLLFFWLPTIEMAINRVAIRVSEGGHNIPTEVIARRYSRGIENLFKIYIPLCDDWAVFDNSDETPELIAEGVNSEIIIAKDESWNLLKSKIS
ncbi:MAG: zeta toxin family protein [Flavobacterium sp.]|uniref:zeta toxin family protein n=1 Tax=Flavobacterium sp. TaxID=239 RepID=UPI0022BC46D1|nr:zeta toxin family protein [Flavobacterium sp.]MCZ8090971.1 zeta toxin family protein [Flavobacterium sp.]MCZ8331102.1 zeta toxin family protein [Flavobacterium sp.]